jgi:CRISPR-associated endonuclease Csn1
MFVKKDELIYSFDLGSGSIGVCVRRGEEILCLESFLIDSEYASAKEASSRRKQIRTRIAHKEREKWWDKQAKLAGLEVLSTSQPSKEKPNLKPDIRMQLEFSPKDSKDKTIYSSCLLRIALLQGVKLESWQVYKAIRSAIQRRGYDANLPWAQDPDKQENLHASNRYDEKLKDFFGDNQEYYYPCYYEASIQGIWDIKTPKDLTGRLSSNPNPARNKDTKDLEDKCFPSRHLVEKELEALLLKAAKLLPKLKDKEKFLIYGPAKEAYASYKNEKYTKYRGTDWDWQGLLSQKVPRFDNRIIAKCRLIERLNVCKANKQINKDVSFLLALKNMRYSKDDIPTMQLNPQQINEIFEIYEKYIKSKSEREKDEKKQDIGNNKKRSGQQCPFSVAFWKKYINKLGGEVNPAQTQILKPKDSGRSSFCKPALNILRSLILSGKGPHDYYKEIIKQIKNDDSRNGLVKDDYKFLLNMPNDWSSISIQDTREDDKQLSHHEAESKILSTINGMSNRIVRHRLTMLLQILNKLQKNYGLPDKVIFEIAREDFIGEKKKREYEKLSRDNKKKNDNAVKELKECKLNHNKTNMLKFRLGEQQKWEDVYNTSSSRKLSLQDIEEYEIDHIVPQSAGGSDSFSNFVLTKSYLNKGKGELIPYDWFMSKRKDDWETYKKNVQDIYAGDKKANLLISDKASEYEKRKTDLVATSYIEKLAQKIAGLYFGFGVNTSGDKRRIFFYTGGETAKVRGKLHLNELLYASLEEYEKAKEAGLKEKNRDNEKHHALDALVLSMLPEIKTNIEDIDKPDYFDRVFCKKHLKNVIPEKIRQVAPRVRETIYGLRCRIENGEKRYYFISHLDSSINKFKSLKDAREDTDKMFDLKIKNDFKKKLEENGLTQESWEKWLSEYTGNSKRIKKIAKIDDGTRKAGFSEKEVFNPDGKLKSIIGEYGNNGMQGQWIKGHDSHQGQIVYKEENKWKVEPVYVFESLYKKRKFYENKYDNMKFFRSGQLIELKKSYKDKDKEIVAGIYKLRTLLKTGRCKLENIDSQEEIIKSIASLIENCGMTTYKKK